MPIAPSDFFQAANNLYQDEHVEGEETRCRTAAGRAYYAAYLAVNRALERAAGRRLAWVEHGTLSRLLRGAADMSVSDIGLRLDGLRGLRRTADYKPNETVTRLEVGLQLANASAVLRSADHNRRGILDAYRTENPNL